MILLYWLALLLFAFFGVVNFVYLWVSKGQYPKGYWRQTAINIDKFGNREFRALWNRTLIKPTSLHKFGKETETISEVLGHNYVDESLTTYGELTVFLLSARHCLDSAGFVARYDKLHIVAIRVVAWCIFPLLYILTTPQRLRIAFWGVLMSVFGYLTNHTTTECYLYFGMTFVFLFIIDVIWFILKSLR